MADIIKNENFTADVLLNLLSETTDDYLYMWDIRNGTFYISDNAYDDLDISRLIEQDVVSVWSKIMVREDLELWLSDMQMIQEGSKDYHDMEYRVYNKSGRVIWVSCRGTVKKDRQDRPLFMIGRISNIGKQNKFDNVTGLMNRNQFEQDMNILVRQKDTANGVVVVLDIDNFKNINEKYGYGFGDRALNLLSNLISAMLPQGCQLYRLDGDEFVFLIKDGTKEAVRGIYENIQMFIGSHFAVEGRQILISLSAGACFFPDDGNTYQKLFKMCIRDSSRGTASLDTQTNADMVLIPAVTALYERIVDPGLLVHRINISVNHVVEEEYRQYSLFSDEEELERNRKLQAAMLDIKKKYGRNAILKGMNLQDASTMKERNRQIGGHKSGE